MTMRITKGLAALLVLVIGLGACETFPPRSQSSTDETVALDEQDEQYTTPVAPEPGLKLGTDQRFKDIPLPVGLKEDEARTFVYESPDLQIGRMVYTSRDGVAELAQFFIRECPIADWELQNVLEAGGKTLTFTKPGRRLVVSISDENVATGRRIVILFTPLPAAGAPALSEL